MPHGEFIKQRGYFSLKVILAGYCLGYLLMIEWEQKIRFLKYNTELACDEMKREQDSALSL